MKKTGTPSLNLPTYLLSTAMGSFIAYLLLYGLSQNKSPLLELSLISFLIFLVTFPLGLWAALKVTEE